MLCNSIWRVGRNTQNGDAVLLSRFDIYIIKSRAPEKNQADAAVMKDFNDLSGRFIIDKNAYCVKAGCQMGGFCGQAAGEVLY